MTISFYTPLKGASNGRFGAMWAKFERSDFFQILLIKRFHSIEKNIKFLEKLIYRKYLAYLFCTTLNKLIILFQSGILY